jgi:hypothetical protein
MRSFVDRRGARVPDVDPSTREEYREKMRDVLVKKQVSVDVSEKIVAQTLKVAAAHRLESARNEQHFKNLQQSRRNLSSLIRKLRRLDRMTSYLPARSMRELNRILWTWRSFDTEMFEDVIREILDALSAIPAARIAEKAYATVVDGLPQRKRPSIKWIDSARPLLTELWETMPAQTRAIVEGKVRRWQPPKRSNKNNGFLKYLIGRLQHYRPVMKRRRRPALEGRYIQAVASIWNDFGLRVGRAYDGIYSCNIDSPFQRFARLALLAVEDKTTRVSVYQIRKAKKLNR